MSVVNDHETSGRCTTCGINVANTEPQSLLWRAERLLHGAELVVETFDDTIDVIPILDTEKSDLNVPYGWVFVGILTYDDSFGGEYISKYCVHGTGGSHFHKCPSHNEMRNQ